MPQEYTLFNENKYALIIFISKIQIRRSTVELIHEMIRETYLKIIKLQQKKVMLQTKYVLF